MSTNLFQHGNDITEYRLLTDKYIDIGIVNGREILKIEPQALTLLIKNAIHDVSFFQRKRHLSQVAAICNNPTNSDNDRFVAHTMLRNSVVAAKGVLPWCQDTGTSVILASKGENVFTGVNDTDYISQGVYEAFQGNNLRYSQVVAESMFSERNSGTNLPAQIEIEATEGNSYNFLIIQKGGGSANKTFLYQETKSLLNEKSFDTFIRNKIKDIGTSACPPYHLVVVVGGLSAEMTLKTVKLASAGALDDLPTYGDSSGRAFRDKEWEQRIVSICAESGIGAQYGGKCFAHDVRVIRLPRHAASCPVGLGVSCSADRNIKAKITPEGIFIEKLEYNPEKYLPTEYSQADSAIPINLDLPIEDICNILSQYPVMTRLNLSGTLIVARDMAHARICKMVEQGEEMPEYFKKHPIYYAGPAKTPTDMVSGSLGPTTAGRMDIYVDSFQKIGGSLIMLAKGNRSHQVEDSCKKYGGFYLGTIGGPAAVLAAEHIKEVRTIDFEEYGMEAIREIKVENMPAFILINGRS